MFGGVLTLVLVVVMRVLVARQWALGIGLNPKRRLMLPGIAAVIGLIGLRRGAAEVFDTHVAAFVVIAFAVTVLAGVVRAATVAYSAVPETDLYPGGVRLRARRTTLAADVVAAGVAAVLVLPTVASVAGLHPAAGVMILAVACGDLVASGLLMLRGRPAAVSS